MAEPLTVEDHRGRAAERVGGELRETHEIHAKAGSTIVSARKPGAEVGACCAPVEQESCCEPAAKRKCCGAAADGSACRCRRARRTR